ncbi:hypothetical protein [Moraxella bovis]|uniref:DUF968 domain-containing protein n=1 Tax=Moraxella bovis TaxID=476 RepID=UPI002225D7D3|nr:hypothetical protein [Moraxella bovis]UYZ80278.1 hypothetical protein LP113_09505 [Moraxella bovis]UYZ88028.1 hypothetical protein LP094_06945 [Moraxella bovis]UYZ96626.1 hypothetical protein LP107_06930 [Moraxella bovis]UYZ97032.1 hypothetical protein LP107_09120 [Moraxella bovis]UYZ99310.1 hypothetical protein LP086_06955 [Moraxella bovis]
MNRLNRIKSLPCVQCHAPPPSDPCHANWGEFGKGMGTKSDDEYTIPLCRKCHQELDTYQGRNRERAKAWFLRKLEFVNSVLNEQDNPTENLF